MLVYEKRRKEPVKIVVPPQIAAIEQPQKQVEELIKLCPEIDLQK